MVTIPIWLLLLLLSSAATIGLLFGTVFRAAGNADTAASHRK